MDTLELSNSFEELKKCLLSEEINSLKEIEDNISNKKFVKEAVSDVIISARKNPNSIESKSIIDLVPTGIREHIKKEPEKAIDTFFPIIGPIVSKFVSEAIADSLDSINEKIESRLPLEDLSFKCKSLFLRIPEEELILAKMSSLSPKAMFVIEKETGIVKFQVIEDDEMKVNSDLFAGLLTALQDFSRDCINDQNSKLDQIEYGDLNISIEECGSSNIAIVTKGKIRLSFKRTFRKYLSHLLLKYPDFISEFDKLESKVNFDCSNLFYKLKENSESPKKLSLSKKIVLGICTFFIFLIPLKHFVDRYQQQNFDEKYEELFFHNDYPLIFDKDIWGNISINGHSGSKEQARILYKFLVSHYPNAKIKVNKEFESYKLKVDSIEHRLKSILLMVSNESHYLKYRITEKRIIVPLSQYNDNQVSQIKRLVSHYNINDYIILR